MGLQQQRKGIGTNVLVSVVVVVVLAATMILAWREVLPL